MKRNATKLAALLGGLFIALALFASPTHADDIGPEVVGGTPAAQGEFPWVVHLSMGCGGSFIREDIILTAAHCVSGTGNNTSITVEYGNVNLGSGTTIRSNYVHDSGSVGNDWALIRLQSKVAGAALLPLGNTSHDTGDFTIMGWGATSEGGSGSNRLLKATVPFVADDTCDDYYGSRLNKTTEICAGFPEGGTDTCQGDSGGPMVKNTGSGYVQVGIVSWGDGCARPDAYGIYAQVSYFASAINAKAEELSPGGSPGGVTVANPGSQTSTVGTAVNRTNSASGGTAPYTWSATGLPAGLSISASTGTITGTPTTAGSSNVTVTATDSSSPALTGSASFTWTVNPTGDGSCAAQTNGTDFAIADNATVESPITLSDCTGAASATAKVAVNIQHTYIGDLKVDLVAPDGSVYVLHNRAGGSADNINTTYTVDLSSETANGTWKLRVNDNASQDTGKIDTWTLDAGGGGTTPTCAAQTNGTDFAIADNATVESPITIAGCTGTASATAKVAVNIQHTYIGDLKVDLVAPDGSIYVLHNRTGGSADNINATYTVNLSAEAANGTWKLRVNDNASQDVGKIDTWTLTP
jgi:subtilisin-like proprotein convertase family protein/secreted trypsin-like serine protease